MAPSGGASASDESGGGAGAAGAAAQPAVPGGAGAGDFSPRVMAAPSDSETKARVQLFIDTFNTGMQAAYIRLLRAPNAETVDQEKASLEKSIRNLDRCITQYGAPEKEGPYFLGASISLAESVTAPYMLRIMDALPALRSVDVPSLCAKWGCKRLSSWVAAVAQRPPALVQFVVDKEYVVKVSEPSSQAQ